jgi:hypothetical protein
LGVKTIIQNNRRQIRFILSAFLAVTAALANLSAATITVTSDADSGAGTLRAAVGSATNGDTIIFSLPTPSKITLTSGEIAFNQSIDILGPGPTNLLLDGNSNGFRIFDIFNHSTNAVVVTIAGLTMTNAAAPSADGAAIYNQSTTLTVSNCVFSGNSALPNYRGGAIANVGTYFGNVGGPAQLYLVDSIFENNSAFNGGAVFNESSGGFQGRPTRATAAATNCTFRGNLARTSGGAIANGGGTSIVQVANCTLTGNTASIGGAIDNGFAATGSFGPGIGSIQLGVNGSTLSSNTATYGGAIFSRGIMAVLNSTFAGNIATNGGAINNAFTVAITNSTFSGNTASQEGGAMDNVYNTSCTVVNSTFKGDHAPALGSGIHDYGANLQIGGTILNETGTASIYDAQLQGFGVTSLGYNLSGDDGGGYLTNATDQINTDPLLGPLQDNGGPTFTHAPLPGSPAIDKGTNFGASATDQRGWPRTFDKAAIANAAGGDGTDIGAVESHSYTVVNANDSGTGSLRQAIADSNAQPGTNTVDFAPSAYGTILLTSGELLLKNSVFIVGPGETSEVVDGTHASRVFSVSNTVATLAGMTITNALGSGIYSSNATLTVSNCLLTGNSSDLGGAIFGWFVQKTGSLTVTDSSIVGNSAGTGGGIYTIIGSGGTATVQMVNCVLARNSSTNSGGGGGVVSSVGGNGANATVQILNCTVNSNICVQASGGSGAGVKMRNIGGTASYTVQNSTFAGNNGAVYGGGIEFLTSGSSTATVSVANCTFSGNSSGYGGGSISCGNQAGSKAQLHLLNSTFVGDSMINSTMIANDPFSDGAGKADVGSTVFLANKNGGLGLGISVNSLGYNLSSADEGTVLTNATDQINTDPKLGPLQDNGGPTFTHAPLPGSPAIDKGKNFSSSDTDQRGFARTLDIAGLPNAAGGDGTDIGAVESKIAWVNNPGVVSNHFGFDLIGPASNSIIVEASSNVIGNWTALATNVLGSTPLRFTDPAAPTSPRRFYRARVP